MARRSSRPMHVIYGMLHSDLRDEQLLRSVMRHRTFDYTPEFDPNRPMGDAEAMDIALDIAENVWLRSGCEMTISIAEPGAANSALIFENDRSGLILHKGSVLSTLSLGSIRVAGFAIGLFCNRGLAPSQRAERILEDTRMRALNSPDAVYLERLDEQARGAYRNAPAVIVFLHGLLSTDAGLFDSLIRLLRTDPVLDRCAFVGWPHDTLAGIDSNSTKLRSLIDQVVGVDGPPVLFVAHSRGGLLARSVAVKLYDKNQMWTQKLIGCVTFGTPHEGCPLAEAPGQLLGKLICMQAFRGTGSWLSLADALTYVDQSKDFRGIEHLRPVTGGGDFLRDLLDSEARYAPDGVERALDIMAVGGRVDKGGLVSMISSKALATVDHDLVVETRSSIPRLFGKRFETDCNHFGYFDESEMGKDHILDFFHYIGQRIGKSQTASLTPQVMQLQPAGSSVLAEALKLFAALLEEGNQPDRKGKSAT